MSMLCYLTCFELVFTVGNLPEEITYDFIRDY